VEPALPEATGQVAVGRHAERRAALERRPAWHYRRGHTFALTPADGGTRLVQAETFSGILVPFSGKTIAAAEISYQALNEALKEHVETR